VFLTLPIREVIPATPRAQVVRLDLNGQRFDYAAGQAVFIGPHGVDKRKPYSIAAAPEDAARDGWIELLVGLEATGQSGPSLPLDLGTLVDVEGPTGTFTFPDQPIEQRFVFIAGGTGIAPLRAMLRHALLVPHRNIGLLYSVRTADDFAYQDELQQLARERRIELRQTVTRDATATWPGPRGRIGRAELQPLIHDPATLCFICGPRTLVDEMPPLLEELGVPRTRIKVEEW
jgi:ferredoxin-NADP reductase